MRAVLRGRVVDAAGNGVQRASVYVAPLAGSTPDIAAITDDHGRFSMALRTGSYRIGATAAGFQNATVTIEVFDQRDINVEITMERKA